MPPVDLPRGNAAKPVAPRPASAYRNPPAVVPDARPHGAGTLTKVAPAPPRPRSAYTAPAPKHVVPDVRPHGAGTLTQVTPGATQPQSAYQPSAADRHAAALALINAQHNALQQRATILGASGQTAAIHALHTLPEAAALLHAAPGIAGRLGQELVTLPKSTVQGLWYAGKAGVHDVGHPLHSIEHPLHTALFHLASQAAAQDPLFTAATTGNFSRALHLAEQNPLAAITDVAGGAGVVGRVAGLGARTAGVAEGLAPVARAARPVVDTSGYAGTARGANALERAVQQLAPVDRRFSPNLLKAGLTNRRDLLTLQPKIMPNRVKVFGTDVPVSQFDREMFKRANEHHLISQTLQHRAEHTERAKPAEGLKPVDQRVVEARNRAKRTALYDTYLHNGLVNPRTGNILWAGGKSAAKRTHAMDQLQGLGYDFVRVPLRRSMTGAKSRSVIIPKTLHDTITQHEAFAAAKPGIAGGATRFLGQRFRRSVLPYSTKWVLGNTAEASLRTMLRGAFSPAHALLGHRLTQEMRVEGLHVEANRLESQALQGTHFSMQKRDAANYTREHPVTAVRGVGKVLHALGKPADVSFAGNQRLEQAFAHAVLGKYASADLKAIRKAHPEETKAEHLRDLAHLYAQPEKAAAAGRFGREVLGKYGAFGPSAQRAVRSIAPFSPWYFNAAKFMGTMPTRHPIFTTATQDIAHATEPQWKKEHKSVSGIPGSDVQSLPMVAKFLAEDPGRYLPMGAFTPGSAMHNPLNALGADFTPILGPQFSDAYLALNGLDPFGNTLQYPGPASKLTPKGHVSHGTVHQAGQGGTDKPNTGLAASDIILSILGGTSQGRRILAERGATPYSGTDNIFSHPINPPTKSAKPPFDIAGIIAGLNKVLNPVKPINLAPRHKHGAATTRKGGSGFGGGGRGFGGGSSGFGSGRSGF